MFIWWEEGWAYFTEMLRKGSLWGGMAWSVSIFTPDTRLHLFAFNLCYGQSAFLSILSKSNMKMQHQKPHSNQVVFLRPLLVEIWEASTSGDYQMGNNHYILLPKHSDIWCEKSRVSLVIDCRIEARCYPSPLPGPSFPICGKMREPIPSPPPVLYNRTFLQWRKCSIYIVQYEPSALHGY